MMIERTILLQMLEDARDIAYQQEDTLRKMQASFLAASKNVYEYEPELENILYRAIAASADANKAFIEYSNKLALMWEGRENDLT